jgi:hypothetical protein
MENGPSPLHVRILVFEDLPGIWTARSLEHDIVAESRSIEMAIQAVLRIMRAHADFDRRHNRAPLSAFRAAPQIYWNAFRRGSLLPWVAQLSHAVAGLAVEVTAAVAAERPHAHLVPRDRVLMESASHLPSVRL